MSCALLAILVCSEPTGLDSPLARAALLGATDPVLAVLLHAPVAPAGRIGSGPGPGVIFGVDGGYSLGFDPGPNTRGAWGFGARAGYSLRGGVAIDARYDDLGVRGAGAPLQVASGGARYTLPMIVMPFVEARVGAEIDPAGAYFAAAPALGLELPVARHASIEFTARDWLADRAGGLESVLTLQLGVTVRLGHGGH
jgi:hypothetical protein